MVKSVKIKVTAITTRETELHGSYEKSKSAREHSHMMCIMCGMVYQLNKIYCTLAESDAIDQL